MVSVVSQDAIVELRDLIEEAAVENPLLATTYKNLHQGRPDLVAQRILKARDSNVSKAFKMKPIEPKELYDAIRESYLIGMTGFCKQGRPVFALGVGLSGFERAPVDKYIQSHIQLNEYRDRVLLPEASKQMGRHIGTCLKVLDMSNLKLSALNRVKILTAIATVDDLNYPEKTDVYYIVNAPYIFAACWKVVRPLLQERTRRKIQVLQGSGKDELLKVMDDDVLPHFCKSKGRGSSSRTVDCYSSLDPFHVAVWNHIKQQSYVSKCVEPVRQSSYHVEVPDPAQDVRTIETVLAEISQDSCITESSSKVLDDD